MRTRVGGDDDCDDVYTTIYNDDDPECWLYLARIPPTTHRVEASS